MALYSLASQFGRFTEFIYLDDLFSMMVIQWRNIANDFGQKTTMRHFTILDPSALICYLYTECPTCFFFLFSFWMLHDVVISSSWRSVRNLRSRLAHPYPAPICHGLPFQPCIGATSTLTFSVLCYNDSRSNISWSNGSEEASSSGKATIVRVWLRAGTTPIGGKSGSVTTPEPLQPFLVLYSQFHR